MYQPIILLIEDEPGQRMLLSILLKRSGFEVIQANSGEVACELYRANADRICLVLTDVSLPGLDGVSTIARLRECNPQVRFCFITGGDTGELLDQGAAHVFQKPFAVDEFAQTMKQLAAA
jgi:DNA-binding response OmpR family regulator